jgi:hypothetical protein
LEALGPAPDKKGGEKQLSPKVDVAKPTQIQQRERPSSNDQENAVGGEQSPLSTASTAPSQAEGLGVNSKAQHPNSSIPPAPPGSRRPSHVHDSRRNDLWGGTGTRPERFPSWGSEGPPASRNVWGSPDNDRGLGNRKTLKVHCQSRHQASLLIARRRLIRYLRSALKVLDMVHQARILPASGSCL